MAKKKTAPSVKDISAAIKKEHLPWQAGDTSLSALSPAQQKRYLGVKTTAAEIRKMASESKELAAVEEASFAVRDIAAPASKDWRAYTKTPKNQGGCGSCVAFGTCDTIESNIRIKSQSPDLKIDLSEAFCLFCGGGSCSGWGLTSGLAFAKSTGVTDEACFPYQAKNMPCSNRCSDWSSRLTKILDYTGHSSMAARKDAIASIGPVVGGMRVYNDFFAYKSGIYVKSTGASVAGYHCITIVGYNDSQQYWLIKNSWGSGWGENGFGRIKYGQADLLIDSAWQFYSVKVEAKEPDKGVGPAKYLLTDYRFGTNAILWAHVGGSWKRRVMPASDLRGLAQVLYSAKRVDVWWSGSDILMVRPWEVF